MPDIDLPIPKKTKGPLWAEMLVTAIDQVNNATDETTELVADGRLSEDGVSGTATTVVEAQIGTPGTPIGDKLNTTIAGEVSTGIAAEVPPAVVAAIAADSTVVDAASAAVAGAVATNNWAPTVESVALAGGVWIPATELQIVSGTPTLAMVNGIPRWAMQPSLTEIVGCTVNLTGNMPDMVDIDVMWTNAGAVAGTVQIQTRYAVGVGPGSNLAGLTETTRTQLVTAPAQNIVQLTHAGKGVKIAGGLLRLNIRTTGVGTLAANDIAILGVFIRPSVRLAPARRDDTPLPGSLSGLENYNMVSYTRDSVVTVGTTQYAVWIDDSRKPIIGKRTLPSKTWTTFDLSTVAGNPMGSPTDIDGHNNYSLGVDPSGHIHVSGNHHDDPLQILRSTSPGDITAWAVPTLTGIPSGNRNSVTYIQFITSPAGDMWMWIRNGGSGNGAMFLNKWDDTAKAYNHMSRPLSGFTIDGSAVNESPYVNTPSIDSADTWHLFFMWRVTDDLSTTHDFGYLKSTNGINWTTADGTAMPAITTPTTDDPALIFTGFADQMNQNGAVTDSANRPHTVMWVRSPATTGPSYLRHYWWDGTVWHQDDEVVAAGASPTFRSRPIMAAYGTRIFAIYQDWPVVGIEGSTIPRKFTRWWIHDLTVGGGRLRPFVFLEEDLGQAEITHDWRGLAASGKLNMLITKGGDSPTETASSVPGRILTLDLADIITNPPA